MRFYLIVLVLFVKNLCFTQGTDDFQILNRLVDKSLMPIQDFFVSDSIKSIKIKIIAHEKDLSDLIRIKLLRIVEEDTNSVYSMDVLVEKAEIKYPEIVSFPLFGEERVKRETALKMFSVISKSNMKIREFDFDETISDTVKLSQISTVNRSLKHELPEVPIYRRLVEPALISAATGIIVYLFFITRSK